MAKITYKEAMTRGRIKKAILIANNVIKNLDGFHENNSYWDWPSPIKKEVAQIIEILKSI